MEKTKTNLGSIVKSQLTNKEYNHPKVQDDYVWDGYRVNHNAGLMDYLLSFGELVRIKIPKKNIASSILDESNSFNNKHNSNDSYLVELNETFLDLKKLKKLGNEIVVSEHPELMSVVTIHYRKKDSKKIKTVHVFIPQERISSIFNETKSKPGYSGKKDGLYY